MKKQETDNVLRGLSSDEVNYRISRGLINTPVKSGTRTIREIIHENVFTFFNLIFVVLAIMVITAGYYTDMTFLVVAAANTAIGIVQEVRSKKAVDRLTILAEHNVEVLRDGKWQKIPSGMLVRDDVIIIEEGAQIPSDGVVVQGSVKANEALITGEEADVDKEVGDTLHSGSVCTAGRCMVRLTAVGKESYAAQLTSEATTGVKIAKSDMMKSLDKLIRMIGIALIPIGILLFINEYMVLHQGYNETVRSVVAGLIGMIPEGLYLLTSVALAASVLRLSKKRVLVRDLDCVETLARIDTLCVDKTGTITEPGMNVEKMVILDDKVDEHMMHIAISAYARSFAVQNETGKAIARYFYEEPGWHPRKVVPFSSTTKYSSVSFAEFGTLVVGAPQFVMQERYEEISAVVHPYVGQGKRVVLVAGYGGNAEKGIRAKDVVPLALLVLTNNIRRNAKETFAYFHKQGVNIKVISGDDPETVSQIARLVEIEGAEKYIDASKLRDEELDEAMENYTVFGRTTPEMKKKMVLALQNRGHYVAMTGDGVNDVLALKEADCGIAMASGTEAASQIAQLVLLDSDFSAVPSIVLEGRRVINNIGRSARLFLSKNIFSFFLSVFCVILQLSYPLVPLQLSFVSALTIGIPGFFLAMQPNDGRVSGHFISTVLYYAFPGGLCNFLIVGSLNAYGYWFHLTEMEISTLAVSLAFATGLVILYNACRPLNKFRGAILCSMALPGIGALLIFDWLLGVYPLSKDAWIVFGVLLALIIPLMKFIQLLIRFANRQYHALLDRRKD